MSITGCRSAYQHNRQWCGEWQFRRQGPVQFGCAKADPGSLPVSELAAQPLDIKWQIAEDFTALTHRLDQPVAEHQFNSTGIARA